MKYYYSNEDEKAVKVLDEKKYLIKIKKAPWMDLKLYPDSDNATLILNSVFDIDKDLCSEGFINNLEFLYSNFKEVIFLETETYNSDNINNIINSLNFKLNLRSFLEKNRYILSIFAKTKDKKLTLTAEECNAIIEYVSSRGPYYKKSGVKKGATLERKNKKYIIKQIINCSKDFEGNMNDIDAIKSINICRNTYYKYKKEIRNLNYSNYKSYIKDLNV